MNSALRRRIEEVRLRREAKQQAAQRRRERMDPNRLMLRLQRKLKEAQQSEHPNKWDPTPFGAWLRCKGNSILDPDRVRRIRAACKSGHHFQSEVAALEGVSKSTINRVVRRVDWAWVK